jgi:hypothetical protein
VQSYKPLNACRNLRRIAVTRDKGVSLLGDGILGSRPPVELFVLAVLELFGAVLGAFLMIFAAVFRLAGYLFSEAVRVEIEGKYRDRSRWVKWWYLSWGSLAAVLAVALFALPFYLLATLPASQRPEPHHPVREKVLDIWHKIHKPHPQD